MHFRLIIFISLAFFCVKTFAQQNPPIFSVDNKNVGLDEFKKAFQKSHQVRLTENKDIARSFLDNYIVFKLKVAEARKNNLDRGKNFKSQVEKYKRTIIQPYITDKTTIEQLAKQVYQRMKTEIKIRHILIKVHRYADPKDTLLAYQKALDIRKELINGKNFNELAVAVSDQPGAAINKGESGYVSVFSLPYSIENYIYNSNYDNYSLPLRSGLGYHIIKIIDKRNTPGYWKVSHIMIASPDDTSKVAQLEAKNKIDDIYIKLANGEDFNQLAEKYSEDVSSLKNGEELDWIKTGYMPDDFEKTCLNLRAGSFSKPIKTRFGWHIIKKIEKKELPPYSIVKEQIEKKIINSNRGKIAQRKSLNRLKKELRFKDFQSLAPIYRVVDSTIFEAKWTPFDIDNLNDKLFEFNNRTYYQKDFINHLKNNQESSFQIPIRDYVFYRYKKFVDRLLLNYKMDKIENENKEISYQINDYVETVLANNIMESKVWSKISEDKKGIQNYYAKNKEKYNNEYQVNVSIFKYSEELKKIEKQIKKLKKNNASDEEVVAKIKAGTDIRFELLDKGVKEEGEDKLVDLVIEKFKTGELNDDEKLVIFENEKRIILINSKFSKTNKDIEEVQEQVLEDYKVFFENNWIKQLKRKYKVEINENVFESIFNN